MPRTPGSFKKTDLERLIKGAKNVGLPIYQTVIHPNGKIEIFHTPPPKNELKLAGVKIPPLTEAQMEMLKATPDFFGAVCDHLELMLGVPSREFRPKPEECAADYRIRLIDIWRKHGKPPEPA